MKHVCLTYHMNRAGMDAETCITLPMTEDNAQDLIANGEDSVVYRGNIAGILQRLATIQGYNTASFCTAEMDRRWPE